MAVISILWASYGLVFGAMVDYTHQVESQKSEAVGILQADDSLPDSVLELVDAHTQTMAKFAALLSRIESKQDMERHHLHLLSLVRRMDAINARLDRMPCVQDAELASRVAQSMRQGMCIDGYDDTLARLRKKQFYQSPLFKDSPCGDGIPRAMSWKALNMDRLCHALSQASASDRAICETKLEFADKLRAMEDVLCRVAAAGGVSEQNRHSLARLQSDLPAADELLLSSTCAMVYLDDITPNDALLRRYCDVACQGAFTDMMDQYIIVRQGLVSKFPVIKQHFQTLEDILQQYPLHNVEGYVKERYRILISKGKGRMVENPMMPRS